MISIRKSAEGTLAAGIMVCRNVYWANHLISGGLCDEGRDISVPGIDVFTTFIISGCSII